MLERGRAAVAHHGAGRRRVVAAGAAQSTARGVAVMRGRSRDTRRAAVGLRRQDRGSAVGRRRRRLRRKFRLQR